MPVAKTVFDSLFPKAYYTGRPVANKRPVYPASSTTFIAYNERHNTVGQCEHALRVMVLKPEIVLDKYGLPTIKEWDKNIAQVLVERYKIKDKKTTTGIKTPFQVPVWARVLLLSSEVLLGMDNSMARVASEIVLATLKDQQNSRLDMVFRDKAESILAVEFEPTKSTRPCVMFTTVDNLLAEVIRVNKLAHWFDSNLESIEKRVEKSAPQVVEVDANEAW